MGYNTQFQGVLKFRKQLTLKQCRAIEAFIDDEGIDLTLTEDDDGLMWNGSEKTYDLDKGVNSLIKYIQEQWPDFGLEGHLDAQGDEIGDLWRLAMIDNQAVKLYPKIGYELKKVRKSG